MAIVGRLASLKEPKVVEFAKLVGDRNFRTEKQKCVVVGQKNLLELAGLGVTVEEVMFPMRTSPNRRKKVDDFVAAARATFGPAGAPGDHGPPGGSATTVQLSVEDEAYLGRNSVELQKSSLAALVARYERLDAEKWKKRAARRGAGVCLGEGGRGGEDDDASSRSSSRGRTDGTIESGRADLRGGPSLGARPGIDDEIRSQISGAYGESGFADHFRSCSDDLKKSDDLGGNRTNRGTGRSSCPDEDVFERFPPFTTTASCTTPAHSSRRPNATLPSLDFADIKSHFASTKTFFSVAKDPLKKIAGLREFKNDLVGKLALPPPTVLSELPHPRLILALEHVRCPGVVGTLLRTALAFKFHGVLLTEGCPDLFETRTLRASQCALWTLPYWESKDLFKFHREISKIQQAESLAFVVSDAGSRRAKEQRSDGVVMSGRGGLSGTSEEGCAGAWAAGGGGVMAQQLPAGRSIEEEESRGTRKSAREVLETRITRTVESAVAGKRGAILLVRGDSASALPPRAAQRVASSFVGGGCDLRGVQEDADSPYYGHGLPLQVAASSLMYKLRAHCFKDVPQTAISK